MSTPLNKLRIIAKAKFSDKSNLGTWYQNRLEICSLCPYNSKNKQDLTIRDKAVVAMNFGKDSCLACTCEINAKASVRSETCGLIKINEEPLWRSLPEIDAVNVDNFHIENLNSDKVKMTVTDIIKLDYGTIKYKDDTEIEISLKDLQNLTTSIGTSSSCGCTVPTPRKIGDTFFINIKYDSTRIGKFEKTIVIRLNRNNSQKVIQVKILGTVIK